MNSDDFWHYAINIKTSLSNQTFYHYSSCITCTKNRGNDVSQSFLPPAPAMVSLADSIFSAKESPVSRF